MSDLAVGLAVVGLGIALGVGSFTIELGSGYDRIGPRFFPYLVAVGLILSGSWLALDAWKSKSTEGDESTNGGTTWPPLAWLSLGLLLSLVLFELAGFVVSSSVLFWMVARSFQSKRPVRDAGVALVLSTLVYFAFTKGLGLMLPTGLLGWLG